MGQELRVLEGLEVLLEQAGLHEHGVAAGEEDVGHLLVLRQVIKKGAGVLLGEAQVRVADELRATRRRSELNQWLESGDEGLAKSECKSGFLGVRERRGKYYACTKDGWSTGPFDDPIEAARAYRQRVASVELAHLQPQPDVDQPVVSQRVSQRKRVQTPKAAEAGQGDKQAKCICISCKQPKPRGSKCPNCEWV